MPLEPQDVVKSLDGALGRAWAAHATGVAHAWRARISLAPPKGRVLEAGFSKYLPWIHQWMRWAETHGVELETESKSVFKSGQVVPQAVIVPDLDTAARLVGEGWPDRLTRARFLATKLTEQFPMTMNDSTRLRTVVQKITSWADLDIEILTTAAAWFQVRDGEGRTPRQVPIPGMQAKWLNTRQDMVRALSGKEDLGLSAPHPPRVHLTYLDPDHLLAGGRRHDCHSLGDRNLLPYPVRVVLICENKDTVVAFPDIPGGIAVEGSGSGPGAIPGLEWIRSAPLVAYWGDLDADGLEILSQFRSTGVVHHSLFMDQVAYEQWGRFGTNHDRKGRLLTGRIPKLGLHLQPEERAVYEMLCDPAFAGFRRLEQERIPLTIASGRLEALTRR
ncbi:Wadjet anti-phage system protein JetD domain-containing protein [Promicromonospora sp. NPDC023987]|uniref:Wadjet anti-phage system protein JetD domain-containing protein n=1 Tax=Promicromonospora sp. NPDC023987 TaxID=3155360 RepID=UPI0033DEC67D